MEIIARDLMQESYDTVHPDTPLREALRLMQFPSREQDGRRVFGLMVVDDQGKLIGTMAMFDVMFHLDMLCHESSSDSPERPEEPDWEATFDLACRSSGELTVSDIMTRTVVKVDEQTRITDIIEIMVKTHFRRLPVCRGDQIVGVIYISDVFYEIYKHLLG